MQTDEEKRHVFASQDGMIVAIPYKSFKNGTSFRDAIPIKKYIDDLLSQQRKQVREQIVGDSTLLTIDPEIRSGVVCIGGTRIPASSVLEWFLKGKTLQEVLEMYPALEDVLDYLK